MSANEGNAAPEVNAPATPEVPAEGPRVITVAGQEPVEPVIPAMEEAKPNAETPAAGSEEKDPADGEGNPNDRDEKGRFKPGVQKRIDELTRARHDAERETAYWKGLAEGKGAPAKPAPTQPEAPKVPARADFATDEEFQDALVDYKVDQRLADREQKSKQVEMATAKATSWDQKIAAAKAELPDYDAVMDAATMPVAPHVAELLMEHAKGAHIVHFLASNPDALEKMNGMNVANAAFEIASIASKFQAAASAPITSGNEAPAPQQGASPKPAPERAVSKAPPPAASNVGAGRSTESKLEDLSMDDYVARRKAQGASWAR